MAGKGKKSKELKKVQKNGEEVRAANKPEYVTGTGQKLWRVHPATACAGRICDIHNPPQGFPESGWPTHWRSDRALMERICPHGIGHPSKSHMEFLKEKDERERTNEAAYEGIHGCDGCCAGNYDIGKDRRSPFTEDDAYGVDVDEDEKFELDPEFEPYFDDSQSDLFERFMQATQDDSIIPIPPSSIPWSPAWVDHDAEPNGIGPVCKNCHLLIDWHPVDHALGCPWL